MGELTLSKLEEIEELAERLALLEKKHDGALTSWTSLRVTAAGGRTSGHRTFEDIHSLGVQRLNLERAISALLDEAAEEAGGGREVAVA